MPKKPEPTFVIRLVGPGVSPWVVPLRALTRTLEAVQQLLDQRESEEAEPAIGNEAVLHLLEVKSGSAAYRVAAEDPERTRAVLRQMGRALSSPGSGDWDPVLLSPIEALSAIAKQLGCEIEFYEPQRDEVLASIRPTTFDSLSESAFIRGATSVYGRIERVGGATDMHCGLRVTGQPRMVICRVGSEDLVRDLGQFIYQSVLVHGDATWYRRGGDLRYFTINRFEKPKAGSIRESLRKANEAGGSVWDRIQKPGAVVKEMRGE